MVEFDDCVIQEVQATKQSYHAFPNLVLKGIDQDDQPTDNRDNCSNDP